MTSKLQIKLLNDIEKFREGIAVRLLVGNHADDRYRTKYQSGLRALRTLESRGLIKIVKGEDGKLVAFPIEDIVVCPTVSDDEWWKTPPVWTSDHGSAMYVFDKLPPFPWEQTPRPPYCCMWTCGWVPSLGHFMEKFSLEKLSMEQVIAELRDIEAMPFLRYGGKMELRKRAGKLLENEVDRKLAAGLIKATRKYYPEQTCVWTALTKPSKGSEVALKSNVRSAAWRRYWGPKTTNLGRKVGVR